MNIIDGIIPEYQHEVGVTRKLLERVPEEQWGWKPHDKSMGMGQLASHIAESLGWAEVCLNQDELVFDMAAYKPFVAANRAELLALWDKNAADGAAVLKGQTNENLMKTWTMKTTDGAVMVQMPKLGVVRSFLINHMIHHRAQLGVYLRMNNVPVPAIYGPSADEQG